MRRFAFVALALVALALVLAAPLAAASSVRGELRFPQGADLDGAIAYEATEGALDLSAAHPRLSFERAEGWRVTRTWEYVGPPGAPQVTANAQSPRNVTLVLAGGTLDALECAPVECRAVLIAGDGGAIGLAGAQDGPMRWRADDDAFWSGFNESGAQNFHYPMRAGWLAASTRDLGEVRPSASGALTLFLVNASMTSGGDTVDAMPREEAVMSGPLAIGQRTSITFVVLHIEGAKLLEAPGEAALFAPAPGVSVDGTLLAAAAEGRLVVAGQARELRGETLRLDGTVALAPQTEGLSLAGARPLGSALASRVSGDADVRIAGATVAGFGTRTAPLVIATSAAIALAIALGFALYTRLERGSLMENPRRALVHDTLKRLPGSTVADLVRATKITEVVVRHHLRMLEDHQLVVVRGEGKLRAYFALDGATSAAAMLLHVALKDPTRRRVAQAVASAATPASQRDLVAQLGLSQRLVSYHLTKLEEQGLVSGSGAMPRRYVPAPALASFVGDGDAVAA
ncbi:MAG TPA: ArsR family transcriptional regulator [Candidatus Thermoplasmatota archaeon]|nr:ArsR family transcriptional regulator [Candidatus Thermoplasmatota archaeon]